MTCSSDTPVVATFIRINHQDITEIFCAYSGFVIQHANTESN